MIPFEKRRNEFAFEVIDVLTKYYRETNSILILVFFHEIIRNACSTYLVKNSNNQYFNKSYFPVMNSKTVINWKVKKPPKMTVGWKTNIIFYLLEFFKKILWWRKRIAINSVSSIGKKNFFQLLLKYNLSIEKNNQLHVKSKKDELEKITPCLKKIGTILNLKNRDLECFVQNLKCFIETFLIESKLPPQTSSLIISSCMSLPERIMAASYYYNGAKVIVLSHGFHSFFVYDEPMVAYGELSLCHFYITYGSMINFEDHQFQRNTLTPLPKFYTRGSDLIDSLQLRARQSFNGPYIKGLYAPTLFSQSDVYGPYRDFEDNIYLNWQSAIGKNINNVTYKGRPSQLNDLQVQGFSEYLFDDLKTIDLFQYDYFIMDYLSSAFAIIQATNRPIIYFNIGLRNIPEDVLKIIKQRTFWVDIDIQKDLNFQICSALIDFYKSDKKFENKYSTLYCNPPEYSKESSDLKNILNTILKL